MAEKVKVKSGQTLSSIARANNTTVEEIIAANPKFTTDPKYKGGSVIFSGTTVNIPSAGPTGLTLATGPTLATGATLPTVTTLTPEQIAAQLAAAQAAAAAANAAEIARQQQAAEAERLRRQGQSAYDILFTEFNQYGLGSLVEPLKGLIVSGPSSAELTLALRATDAYQKRFAANAERVKKGLAALPEAVYVGLEDKYQGVMRNYGLPATYYSKDTTGRQVGFEKLIANDVSATELEERIILGKERVLNGPPETRQAFRQFFPSITDGDILGYVLDPERGLQDIKRKVTATEIGGAAIGAGLATNLTRAEQLAGYGITGEAARQGYRNIASGLERGRQLSSIYQQTPYELQTAEQEVFNLAGGTEAARERRKLTGLERAEFGKQTGVTSGALGRERAGSF